jgi:hypothetical protein
MNTIRTLLAVSIVAATASANAAVYSISGTETAWDTAPATTTFPGGVPTFTGTLDDSNGGYTFNFGDFTAHVDVFNGTYVADIATVGQIYSGTGNSTVTHSATSVTCTGSAVICNSQPTGPISGTLAFSVSGSTISGTLNTSQDTAGGASTATYSFTGSATAPAVPVPAAAWLFGSGILGLAGATRRRARIA